jgi:uncharacterized membrane protein
MKRLLSKDLGLIFLLTTTYIILVSFPNLNYGKYFLDLGFLVLLFLFTGYSMISLLRPEENYGNILKKPVLILEFSVLLILIISLILKFSYLGLNLRLLVLVLAAVTMILSILAYIRRINYFKSNDYEPPQKPVKEIKTVEKPERTVEKSPIKFKHGFHRDLLIIDIMTVFSLISFFIPLFNIGLVHNILGCFYMLLIPGYLVMVLLLPEINDMGILARLGIGSGLSLVITSLVGLALHYTKYGISINSLLFSLAILTVILVIYAHIRRLRI